MKFFKYPTFVPIVQKDQARKVFTGTLIEMFLWGYFFLFLTKIFFVSIIMGSLEYFAYQVPPVEWAQRIINYTNFDSRNFEISFKTLVSIFGLGSLIGLLVSSKCIGFGHWVTSLSKLQPKNEADSASLHKHWTYAKIEAIILLLITLIAGWVVTEISFSKMFDSEGLEGAGRLSLQLICGIPGADYKFGGLGSIYGIFQWLFGQNLSCIPNDFNYFYQAFEKLIESIYLAFMATFLSVPISFVLSFFASRNLTRHSWFSRLMYALIRAYINITRSIEPLIWAILFSVWIGIGPFAGALALLIHSVSSLVKQYSEAVEGIDDGPLEAIQTTGAKRIAVVWYAVVPQVVLPFLAFTIYRWDINVRMATIIGLVGGGGIGSLLIQEQMLARWTQVGSLAFLIFLIVWCMDYLSARVREAIQ